MGAVHKAIYCPMCLKCSTSQAALRPQGQEWNESSALPPPPPFFAPLFRPPISIAASLINHRSLHPSILLPLSREEKQTAVRVMNSKWIWRAEGPNNFLQRSAAAAAAAARAHGWKQECKQHQTNMSAPRSLQTREKLLFESILQLKSARTIKVTGVCVCVYIMGARVSLCSSVNSHALGARLITTSRPDLVHTSLPWSFDSLEKSISPLSERCRGLLGQDESMGHFSSYQS